MIKASDESIVNLSRDVGPNARRRRRFAKRLGYDQYKSKRGLPIPGIPASPAAPDGASLSTDELHEQIQAARADLIRLACDLADREAPR
ncbi:hypothetical protein JCM10599A_51590 [Paraburkholderia kururiensis]